MKMGFEESQSPYTSGSQVAKAWTETWFSQWMYCPNCGNDSVVPFPPNSPVADFYCAKCADEFELKSQSRPFGKKVADGAYHTKIQRLTAANSPNLVLLRYSKEMRQVLDLTLIPKHYFVPQIIQERPPLAPTARRAGWIGSNILLKEIPRSGRIPVVVAGVPEPKALVLERWQRNAFLSTTNIESRGWLVETMRVVEELKKLEFSLHDLYEREAHFQSLFPSNNNVRAKLRQQLQFLRNEGYIKFLGNGSYRLR